MSYYGVSLFLKVRSALDWRLLFALPAHSNLGDLSRWIEIHDRTRPLQLYFAHLLFRNALASILLLGLGGMIGYIDLWRLR